MPTKFRRVCVAILCQLLFLQSVWAQQPIAQRGLRIVVVEGEAARNVVQQIAARPIVVRIMDANNRPVVGATVVFSAPEVGASGQFGNDAATMRVGSGQDGLASPGVFHPNAFTGTYQIRVTAESRGDMATAIISQTNVAEKRGRGKWIAIGAIVAGAAGAAIAFRGKDNNPANTGPTITFGGSAVGAPK
jgi:hypothetical protein